MGATHTADVLGERWAQLKQTHQQMEPIAKAPSVTILETKTFPILVRPSDPTWEQVYEKLNPIINLQGLWSTISQYFDAGQGAELITAAEIAIDIHAKNPKREKANNLFSASISKKSGNWFVKTLKLVHETWEARQNTLEVAERLKLDKNAVTYRRVLSLAWKLKGTIIRYLGMALEEGRGIKNPAGLFFSECATAVQLAAR
jgi:hypothetical protein